MFAYEMKRIFNNSGVLVIFFLGSLAYPFLYKAMYWNEQINDIPVAVVDMSCSPESREFLHKWAAAPDVKIAYTCASMAEAERLLRDQKVHGIIYFPKDYATQLADPLGQAHISLYCDMSSFLYMKGLYMSCNLVMLETMQNVQIDRYEQMGLDKEFAWQLVQEAPYATNALFSPTGGYGSFLIPAILVMILHAKSGSQYCTAHIDVLDLPFHCRYILAERAGAGRMEIPLVYNPLYLGFARIHTHQLHGRNALGRAHRVYGVVDLSRRLFPSGGADVRHCRLPSRFRRQPSGSSIRS